MAKILDGRKTSTKILNKLEPEIKRLKKCNIFPKLAVILVGNNPASKIYVKNKEKICSQSGILFQEIKLTEDITEENLIENIETLNKDENVHGILIQLPLPAHIDTNLIIDKINPDKDVDGFHTVNTGKVMIGNFEYLPCTAAGIIEILKENDMQIEGKHCVVVGRSNIVGKPTAMLMLHNNATVTICHSKTKNLPEITKTADILVSAIGKPNFITKEMVKEKSIIVDVGINKDVSGKIVGDVNFSEVFKIVSAITPVPGGVGPMTIALLIKNTITSAKVLNKM